MDPIYVTGHRNPDTDSIVAAMAYALFFFALGCHMYRKYNQEFLYYV